MSERNLVVFMHIKFTRAALKYYVAQMPGNESEEVDWMSATFRLSAAPYLYYGIKGKVPLSLQYLMRMSAYEI